MLREWTSNEFLGINERDNRLFVGGSNYAFILKSLRPYGRTLQKVRGCSFHSLLKYKAANQIKTLIRFTKDTGVNYFFATAWDAIFSYSGGAWN